MDTAQDDSMVDRLLSLKRFIDQLISVAFTKDTVAVFYEGNQSNINENNTSATRRRPASNREFEYAAIDAFSSGFKSRKNKPAEMIAKHLDRAMRKGQRGKKDEDFQAELDAVLGLYRFTDDKDVFRTFYHRALAKRLLLAKSASDDFEKAMLKKLKESEAVD